MSWRAVALALAGLVAAAVLGFAGSLLARDTIALPATELSAGGRLVPATTTAPTTASTTTATTTTSTRTEEDDDDDSGRGRGRGRGRGGDDD